MVEQIDDEEKKQSDEIGFERLVFFSDAVMAIAITLMALEIHVSELAPELAAEQIGVALEGLAPHILVYVLSFVVIGTYWVLHHRLFRVIKGYDIRLIWLNLIFLMFVAFVPVATNALGTYPNFPIVTAFYAVSVALMGISEFVLWWYANIPHYTLPVGRERLSLYVSLRILTPPLIFLLSLFIIPLDNRLAQYSWALIIPMLFALRFIFPREHALRSALGQGDR